MIPPPPPKYVRYTKVKKPTDLAGSGIMVPAGKYIVEISPYAASAVGNPDDPKNDVVRPWLHLYWGSAYKTEIGKQDDMWLFSHTVAFQPKTATEPHGSPDPGTADPNLHLPNPLDAVMSVGEFLAKLAEFLLNPVRMGELVVGVLLVGIGVNAILKNPAGKTGKVVARVSPVGKATRAVKRIEPAPAMQHPPKAHALSFD